MKVLLHGILMLLATAVGAQIDLTGKWVFIAEDGNHFELNIRQEEDGKIYGHSYDIHAGQYCRHWMEGSFDQSIKDLYIRDVELIHKTPSHVEGRWELEYMEMDGKEYLVGNRYTHRIGIMTDIQNQDFKAYMDYQQFKLYPNYVRYERKKNSYEIFTEEDLEEDLQKTEEYLSEMLEEETTQPMPEISFEENPSLEYFEWSEEETKEEEPDEESIEIEEAVEEQPTPTKPFYTEEEVKKVKDLRRNDILANIFLKSKTIKLHILDYGKEDHDSISLFYNEKAIIIGHEITKNEEIFEIELDPDQPFHQLVFVANNMGEEPPNTAQIIIDDGNTKFRYKLFTDESANAVIQLQPPN